MSYIRVIPRDLFNEANLLKCYGQLWLKLDDLNLPNVSLEHLDPYAPFNIQQIPDSGSIYISTIVLMLNDTQVYLERPLNSRLSYPLLAYTQNHNGGTNPINVFTEAGELTQSFLELLSSK